ncbi:MAG: hypothetical protein JNK05_39560 [Myxococcales bacterium]|nr:hypothetical protein [Myxococcales bacterium]
MSAGSAPYRHANPDPPSAPPLRLQWADVKHGAALAALMAVFWMGALCLVPPVVALAVAVGAWAICTKRADPRRYDALRWAFALLFPCALGAALLADDRRMQAFEARVAAEARAFHREHGRYPNSRELWQRVPESATPRWPRARVHYHWDPGHGHEPILIRTMFPMWKRITRVATGYSYVLD